LALGSVVASVSHVHQEEANKHHAHIHRTEVVICGHLVIFDFFFVATTTKGTEVSELLLVLVSSGDKRRPLRCFMILIV
jgi:uncharacterized membrane protein